MCQQDYRDEYPSGSSEWLREERVYRDTVCEQTAYALDVAIADFAARALIIFANGDAKKTFDMSLERVRQFENFIVSTPE